eukprot:1561361-Pyramimonas_sp.AAC.1
MEPSLVIEWLNATSTQTALRHTLKTAKKLVRLISRRTGANRTETSEKVGSIRYDTLRRAR